MRVSIHKEIVLQLKSKVKCQYCAYIVRYDGLPFNLVFHYSICHGDKISICVCGDKSLSGICIKELASPMKTDCSFNPRNGSTDLRSRFPDTRNGNSVNPNANPNPNPNPNSIRNPNPNPNSNSNPNPNPNPSSNPISNPSPNPNSNLHSNLNPNPNPDPNPNYNPNPNSNPNPNFNDLRSSFDSNPRNNTNKALTRKNNRYNSLKPPTDFDESKYT